jgi:hypothetical protein
MKNAVFWSVTQCCPCNNRRFEEVMTSIRVTRISELGTTLAVTSNRCTLRRNTNYMERISELGTTLAVTSNRSTLRRNTMYAPSTTPGSKANKKQT